MNKLLCKIICLICFTCFLGVKDTEAVDIQLSYNASNVIFQRGVPLRGSRCKPITFLDICDCKGIIDYTTFSRLPLLRGVNITNSRLNGLFSETFAPLRRLETVAIQTSSINVQISNRNLTRAPIPQFRELIFQNSTVSGLNRNSLQDLRSLRSLSFNYTNIRNISIDVFSDLTNIRHLSIRSSSVTNFDLRLISNLNSLEYLALYRVQNNLELNYNDYSRLPNLNTILFDPARYLDLNFESFRSLRVVEIVRDNRNNVDIIKIIQYLTRIGIAYRLVQ